MAHTKTEIKKAKNLLNKFAPKGEQLAFINSKEAKLLKSKGGAGKMTKAGIRSYFDDSGDDYGGYDSGPSNDDSGDNDDSYNATDAYITPTQPKSILSRIGGFIKGAAGAALTASTFGVGPAVGSLLYKGGKKVASYVTKNINGRLTKVRTSYNPLNKQPRNKTVVNNNGGGNDMATTQVAKNLGGKIIKGPTTAEVSQSSATDVTYDARKTKARGRSLTIRTNSRGIGKNMESVLGTKSLLGTA